MFPQVGGLSAPRRSRVGSLLPISTPTAARGMTWSSAPLKLEKVSLLLQTLLSLPTHTHTFKDYLTHSVIHPHTLTDYAPNPQSLICDKTEQTRLYANGWRRAGVSTSLCLPAIISTSEQSVDSGLGKQQGRVPGESRPQPLKWCSVQRNITWYELMKEACVSIGGEE